MRRAATSDYINYNIYSDSGRSTSWSSLTSQTGTGANQIVTIYGRVPGTQSITNAGNYSDQITVTISY
jgi:spore coat protein U-like protein